MRPPDPPCTLLPTPDRVSFGTPRCAVGEEEEEGAAGKMQGGVGGPSTGLLGGGWVARRPRRLPRPRVKGGVGGVAVGMPTKFSVSASTWLLTRRSRSESVAREGEKFTSSSHGFSSASIMTSKPKSWKQFVAGQGTNMFTAAVTLPSMDRSVFTMSSSTRPHIASTSTPSRSSRASSADSVHLCPAPSAPSPAWYLDEALFRE